MVWTYILKTFYQIRTQILLEKCESMSHVTMIAMYNVLFNFYIVFKDKAKVFPRIS